MSIITFSVSAITPGTYIDPVKGTKISLPFASGVIFSTHSPESTNLVCAIFNVCKES